MTKEEYRAHTKFELVKLNKHLYKNVCRLIRQKIILKEQIADIKANCDLSIEGRDIKIKELELELTVEKDQHQEEINLHLHAEDYIKSLEQQVEKMKCCGNCKFKGCDKSNSYQTCWYCTNKDKWKLRR